MSSQSFVIPLCFHVIWSFETWISVLNDKTWKCSHLFGLTKNHKGGFERFADPKFWCFFVRGLWGHSGSSFPKSPHFHWALLYLIGLYTPPMYFSWFLSQSWDESCLRSEMRCMTIWLEEKCLSLFFFFFYAHATESKFTSYLREPSRPGHW